METIKSNIKTVNIEIPKKNYRIISMSIKENGINVELGENDLLFMTISVSPNSEDYLIQKSLENGITFNPETMKYEIEFNSEDTVNLEYGKVYGYDITIYYDGTKPKQKVIGTFKVTDQFTLNEVV